MLVLVAATSPATAATPRTFTLDYTAAGVMGLQQADGRAYYGYRCGTGCLEFTTARKGERTLTITTADASGLAVGWMASVGRTVKAAGCGRGVIRSTPGETWYVAPATLTSCNAAPTQVRLSS